MNENASFCNSKNAKNKAIVVAGPTASGKSGIALDLAERLGGEIINADSMQVYKDVPTLTARPTREQESRIKHRLYGFLEPDVSFSVFKWAQLAVAAIKDVWNDGKIPVVVGGTGFYIQTLCEGISPVPEVPVEIRTAVRRRFDEIGVEEFVKEVRAKDGEIVLTDPQRVMRAAEVLEYTGRSLSYWQSLPPERLVDADWFGVLTDLPRAELYERCDARFDAMMTPETQNEVRTLLAKNPPADSLIMKAIGVREIKGFFDGVYSREQACTLAKQTTRNYAKRQMTWFRHRFNADIVVSDLKNSNLLTKVLHFSD